MSTSKKPNIVFMGIIRVKCRKVKCLDRSFFFTIRIRNLQRVFRVEFSVSIFD